MHKDFVGNILEIGDVVATTPKDYRGLVKAIVVGFTPQQVRVEYMHQGYITPFLTPSNTMMKIVDSKYKFPDNAKR